MVYIHEAGPLQDRLLQWPVLAVAGSLEVRIAETDREVEAAQRLRYMVFYEEMFAVPAPQIRAQRRDFDRFDDVCDHLLVVDRNQCDKWGQPLVVGTYRLMRNEYAERVGGFYAASEFDIKPMLEGLPSDTRLLELGRSCILKSYRSRIMTMQLLWRGLMAYVARFSIDLMFGCASLYGTDPEDLALPLSYLYHYHLAPPQTRVRATPNRYVEMKRLPLEAVDPKEGLRALTPLLKGYIRAGASIGDGAVIDQQFGTIDVFIYFPLSGIDTRYKNRFSLPLASYAPQEIRGATRIPATKRLPKTGQRLGRIRNVDKFIRSLADLNRGEMIRQLIEAAVIILVKSRAKRSSAQYYRVWQAKRDVKRLERIIYFFRFHKSAPECNDADLELCNLLAARLKLKGQWNNADTSF